ncbi:MAG: hypothetical protein R3B95_07755 [Nitrospirales bacterium]|nr:hypothetical protein [Nitrospirales bacterium]
MCASRRWPLRAHPLNGVGHHGPAQCPGPDFRYPNLWKRWGRPLSIFWLPMQYHITTLPPASPKAKEGLRAALPFPLPTQQVLTVKEALAGRDARGRGSW